MKKLLAIFTATAVLSGCSLLGATEPDQDPGEVVKEAFANLYALSSYAYDADLEGEMSIEGDNVDFKAHLSGAQDLSDIEAPKLVISIDGEGSLNDGDMENISVELKTDSKTLYVMLAEISDLDGAVPTEMVAAYIGQWWAIPIPEGTIQYPSFGGADEENLTTEQQAMKDLVDNTNFFKDLEYIGSTGSNLKYSGTLDKEAVKTFLSESARINGQVLLPAEMAQMEMSIDAMTLEGEIWVDSSDMLVTRITGEAEVEVAEEENAKVKFDLSLSDFDKEVVIEEPEGVKEFDPFMMLGLMSMGMGGAPAGDMPQMDYDMDYDMEAFEGFEGLEGLEGLETL